MFEITPITHVTIREAVLDASAQREMASYLRSKLTWHISKAFTADDLIKQFAPFEAVTPEGKLVKRISKWVKQEYDYKLPDFVLSELGEVVSSFYPGEFTYDITDNFNWEKGDFGDSTSCFWGSNREARNIIYEAGGRAIRFWHDDAIGCGRAWVVPKDGDWFVFNAYGPNLDLVAERLEVIYPQASVRRVNLENWSDTCGMVYINRGIGLQVTERNIDKSIPIRVDLEIGEEEGYSICSECGDRVNEDDGYYIDGETICQHCYENNYFCCEHCEEYRHNGDANYREVVRSRRGSYYTVSMILCDACLEYDFNICDQCDSVAASYGITMTEVEGGDYVCPICLEEYNHCESCNSYTKGECECQEEAERV